jgi:hypothetical protein
MQSREDRIIHQPSIPLSHSLFTDMKNELWERISQGTDHSKKFIWHFEVTLKMLGKINCFVKKQAKKIYFIIFHID